MYQGLSDNGDSFKKIKWDNEAENFMGPVPRWGSTLGRQVLLAFKAR